MVSVPDTPEIVLPTNPVVAEDGTLILSGLGMYDADVSRPGDEELLFDIWLEAVSGHLSLNGFTVSLPETQACADELAAHETLICIASPVLAGYGFMLQVVGVQILCHTAVTSETEAAYQ